MTSKILHSVIVVLEASPHHFLFIKPLGDIRRSNQRAARPLSFSQIFAGKHSYPKQSILVTGARSAASSYQPAAPPRVYVVRCARCERGAYVVSVWFIEPVCGWRGSEKYRASSLPFGSSARIDSRSTDWLDGWTDGWTDRWLPPRGGTAIFFRSNRVSTTDSHQSRAAAVELLVELRTPRVIPWGLKSFVTVTIGAMWVDVLHNSNANRNKYILYIFTKFISTNENMYEFLIKWKHDR